MKGTAAVPERPDSVSTNPLTERSRYAVWTTDRLRLVDLDFQRHVNNVAYAAFCASGRHNFIEQHLHAHVGDTDLLSVATLTIDFLGEMRFPGEVETGTLVRRVGRTSFTLGQGLFKDGKCVGTSQAVMVLVDPVTRRPKPLPPGAVALLERFLEAPAAT